MNFNSDSVEWQLFPVKKKIATFTDKAESVPSPNFPLCQ